MEAIAVDKIEPCFPEILEKVRLGKHVSILYKGITSPVAMIVPYIEEKKSKREIGILDGKIEIIFGEDFEMTTEELIGLQ
jgi:antitoxin (DNA-binding transcriptional repressor) of toxin-antitoxin stability system